MKLNVGRLRKETGATEEFKFSLPALRNVSDFEFKQPIKVEGVISNSGDMLQLKATVQTQVTGQCVRCIQEVHFDLSFEFEENYCDKSADDADCFENNDIILYEDDIIDLETAVVENIILNLPMRVLCNPDCLGICPYCGQNLNEKQCDCQTKIVDPRLAILAKLKKN